ncbi:hypothetical protein B0J11DRAFT_299952 [Dendryphion nanum]|uniref:Uncharacterized protein n=1 Tax=Dendryphion nanum TaxID=256645 RepID=A0A9P9DVC1_9PLEO|nr:hypothetical protein B0J11DRAFT_299952 [Dendryphion nanum]
MSSRNAFPLSNDLGRSRNTPLQSTAPTQTFPNLAPESLDQESEGVSSDESRKRRRANTNGDEDVAAAPAAPLPPIPHNHGYLATTHINSATVPIPDLNECILGLSDEYKTRLLLNIATKQPEIAYAIRVEYVAILEEERHTVRDFDHFSKEVWHLLNTRYKSMSGSKQCEMSSSVLAEIRDIIETIGSEAGNKSCSFATKRSGLETLRKIGKTILLSTNDAIGREVQEVFYYDPSLEVAMNDIIDTMDLNERDQMCDIHDGRSSFLDKMRDLQELADKCGCFAGLQKVMYELVVDSSDDEDESLEDKDEDYE